MHAGGWLPLLLLVQAALTNQLTANPIQAMEQRTGLTALVFLLLSLACSPISAVLGWKEVILRRKALGNYGFLYATLHVGIFFGLDYGLDLAAVWRDVGSKWFIFIGLLAYLLLLPVAITSLNFWKTRLGRNWKRLHRLVYIISPLVLIHFLLSIKGNLARFQGNILQPVAYGLLLGFLLVLRIPAIKTLMIRLRLRLTPILASWHRQDPSQP